MSFNFSPKIITNGLILCLDAANPKSIISGNTTWNDLTTNFNNSTLINGPTYSSANNGSIVFDNVDDYGECLNNSTLQITSDLTINIWLFVTAPKIGLGLITKGPLTNDYDYMLYLTTNSTSIDFYKKDNSGTADNKGGFVSTFINRWVNVCFTKEGTTIRSYENSTLRTTANFTNSQIRTSSNTLKIGRGFSNNVFYGGNIASLQLYNRALTANEVLQNYNALKNRFGL